MKKITQQVSRTVERCEALDGSIFDEKGQCREYEDKYIRKPAEDAANAIAHKFVCYDKIESWPSDTNYFLLFYPKTDDEVATIKNWVISMQPSIDVENVEWNKIRTNSILWLDVEVDYNTSLDDLSGVNYVYSCYGTTEDVICGYVRRVEKCAKELTNENRT